ncbi:hypothetical protein BDN72DRAFT_781569, partial [Pluteus cervinus]
RMYPAASVMARFFSKSELRYLRALQSRRGWLIVGSAALNVLDFTTTPACELDLLVQKGDKTAIVSWLMCIGYDEGPRIWPPVLPATVVAPEVGPIYELIRLERPTATGKMQIIHLYLSHRNPIEAVLSFNLSEYDNHDLSTKISCTMNFLTANDAVSLYPHSTFIQREGLCIENYRSRSTPRLLTSYLCRGWTIVHRPSFTDRTEPRSDYFSSKTWRFVGDNKCWVVPCYQGGRMEEVPIVDKQNGWQLRYRKGQSYTRL